MGRPRKWEADFETFKLIKEGTPSQSKEALDYLYRKYEKAFWNQKHKMDAVMRASNIYGLDTDDYFSETYETFLKAVDSIKLDKVPKSKQATWTFYAQLNGYLMSHNRDQISHHIKGLKNEVSLSGYSNKDSDLTETSAQDYMLYQHANTKLGQSPEDEYFQKKENAAVYKAVEVSRKLYSPLENKIWDLRDQGKTKQEICDVAHIEMKVLNKSLRNMKTILTSNIQSYKEKYLN